ncbi:MAG TPA: hypothetical protein VGL86_03925 [Polyangia bacterium]
MPPLLWMAQGALGWFIAAHACPPGAEPLSLSTARVLIGVLTLIALVATTAGIVAARSRTVLPADASGEPEAATAAAQRRRFVAVFGLFVCVTLTLGLILAGLPSLMLHACGETR